MRKRKNFFEEFIQETKKEEKTEAQSQAQVEERKGILQELSEFLAFKAREKGSGRGRVYQTFCILPETMELLSEVHLALNRKTRVTKTDLLDFALKRTLTELKKELEVFK